MAAVLTLQVLALVSALVNDANALVETLEGRGLDDQAACALAVLALVAGQDVEAAEGSDGTGGRWRIARKVAGDRVVSTVDPDARHTRKSPAARRDGHRAHVAADPETGIINEEKLTKADGAENSDPAVAEEFLAAEAGTGGDAPGGSERSSLTPPRRGGHENAAATGKIHKTVTPSPAATPVTGPAPYALLTPVALMGAAAQHHSPIDA